MRLKLDEIIQIQFTCSRESGFYHLGCEKTFKYSPIWKTHCCTGCSQYITDEELLEISSYPKLYAEFPLIYIRTFKDSDIWNELKKTQSL